ncbi:hypothetical protein [Pseudarthrobacter sp. ATCC 49987]|uniref:hypothetical protein n=1 Tax=Pseudarthrobacter sp. ATCC 49987 TaxID=2698204 RepID=UPI003FCDF2EB
MVVLDSTRESLLLPLALAAVVVGIELWRYRKNGGKSPAAGDAGAGVPAAEAPAEAVTVGASPAS